jgi:hypothetical protein
MSKLFHKAIRLEVKEDAWHRPISFLHEGRRERVGEMLKQWRVAQEWWNRTVEREYFQVRTEAGVVCELYRDLFSGSWYLQRIYD